LSDPAVMASIPVPGPASAPVRRERVLVLRNRQKDRPLSVPTLRRITLDLLEAMGLGAELGFHCVSADEMARVNWQFLGHEGSTDVITFDHGSTSEHLHGECFICVADAVAQARQFGTTWAEEVVRYVIHGILHLRGYDDLEPAARRVMKREENRWVRWTAARGYALGSPVRQAVRRPARRPARTSPRSARPAGRVRPQAP
jgi:probable rRNA maturation factor